MIQPARIDYTNWKGERRVRIIEPLQLWFGATKWHQYPQWLLRARDTEDGQVKDFSMFGVHCWIDERRG